jgi:subtilisin family serine protease
VGALVAQGYSVIEERTIPELGTITRRFAVPAGVSLDDARDQVRALPSGSDADFNHFYRTEQEIELASAPEPSPGWAAPCDGLHCPAFDQIAWPVAPTRDQSCGVPVTIGMIDTGLNEDHTTFAGAALEVTRLSDETLDPSRAVHGTAVAAILVGSPESRSPGLVPWARLVAVDAFHRAAGDERADVVALIEGLGYLADQGAQVINLSLAGPPNTVLQEAIARLVADEGIVIIAAAGNGGARAEPAYPAAYDGVIAVTAVDFGDGIYRRAQQGDYVDLAAPGVEVWTAASISGARSKTGTSFAVPFVTAAAALVLQGDASLTPAEVEARLIAAARDLGDPGRDPVFGAGAVMAADICAQTPEAPVSDIAVAGADAAPADVADPATPVLPVPAPETAAVPDPTDDVIAPAGSGLPSEGAAD